MELDFKRVDSALRRARDSFMKTTIDAISKSGDDYEHQSIYRMFAETICVSYENFVIRELCVEFGQKREEA